MANHEMTNQDMKLEIPIPIPNTNPNQDSVVSCESDQIGGSSPVLARQPSSGASKNSCLCSPTTHAGSFRCRLHRTPSLQRTKSNVGDSVSSNSTPNTSATNENTTIEAQ